MIIISIIIVICLVFISIQKKFKAEHSKQAQHVNQPQDNVSTNPLSDIALGEIFATFGIIKSVDKDSLILEI